MWTNDKARFDWSHYIVTCLEYPLGLDRVYIVSILDKLIPCDVAIIVHVNPPEGQLYPVLLWDHCGLSAAAEQAT